MTSKRCWLTSIWLSNHLKDASATKESDGARNRDKGFGHVCERFYTTLQAFSNIYVFYGNNILLFDAVYVLYRRWATNIRLGYIKISQCINRTCCGKLESQGHNIRLNYYNIGQEIPRLSYYNLILINTKALYGLRRLRSSHAQSDMRLIIFRS